MRHRHTLWIITLLVITAVTLALWPRREDSTSPPPAAASSGQAQIGGAFTLTDQRGNAVTADSLKGRYALVFFGFTHCPDICPAALLAVTGALQSMGAAADAITPVFITVDPARDTVERMHEFAKDFHPRLLALTGTEEQVRQAESAYKVYARIADGAAAGGEDYAVDHSGFIYLMDPQGAYLAHFAAGIGQEELAEKLRGYVEN